MFVTALFSALESALVTGFPVALLQLTHTAEVNHWPWLVGGTAVIRALISLVGKPTPTFVTSPPVATITTSPRSF